MANGLELAPQSGVGIPIPCLALMDVDSKGPPTIHTISYFSFKNHINKIKS